MAKTHTIHSPIDDAVVGTVPAMDAEGTRQALARATAAQGAWQRMPMPERGTRLNQAAQALRDNVDELADVLVREIGKTPQEATDEVLRSADLIDYTVEVAPASTASYEHTSEEFPGVSAGRIQTVTRVPLGTVVAIAPFNYPVNLSVSKIAPGLVTGNTVVFKPPTQGSCSALRMSEVMIAVGIPSEVFQVVTGSPGDVGEVLTTDPRVNIIAMTGSTEVGRSIAAQAGMIPLLLELGGNDPAVVLQDADLELAAKLVAGGAFKYAGQRCTAVKRVYVEEPVAESFVEALVRARNADFGSAGDPRQHPVGPVISDKQAEYLQHLHDDAVAAGGTVRTGGKRSGRYWDATIIDGLSHEARLVQEEQFGPLLPVVRVKDADEAIRLANDSEHGLQACLFTSDVTKGRALAAKLQAGGVHLNDPDQRGPDNFLFVGHKASGLGPQGVRYSLEAMTRLKGIVENHG